MRVERQSGGARRLLTFLLVALCVAAQLAPTAAGARRGASTVRGRVDRRSASGTYPAPYVRVTVLREGDAPGRKIQTYTGKDGMYYFRELQPGGYLLEVWNDGNNVVGRYRINVLSQPVTDVGPVVIR